jgi:hypothetical protein
VARKRTYGDGFTRQGIRDRAECPDCGVPPGAVCDRSRDPCSAAVRSRLTREGTSHYRRMLSAYGVPESKWDLYVARNAAGALAPSPRSARDIAQGEANCPVHPSAVRGRPCPEGSGACPARMRKAVRSAVRREARQQQVTPVPRCPAVPVRPASSCDVLEPVNGPGGDAGFRRWWCLVVFPPTRALAVSGPDGRTALKRAAGRP